tara:strand:+ start:36 stop:230 length:195 start_codon:yes stop_codon:yes gene_type:complete
MRKECGDDQSGSVRPSGGLGEESISPVTESEENLRSIIMRAGDAAMAKIIADLKPEQGCSESDD